MAEAATVQGLQSHFAVSHSVTMPISPLSENAEGGFLNGQIGYRLSVANNLQAEVSVGYHDFGKKSATTFVDVEEYDSDLAFLPILVGVKFFLRNRVDGGTRLFADANIGYYLPAGDMDRGGVGVSPGIGLQVPIEGTNIRFEFSLDHNEILGGKTKAFRLSQGYTFTDYALIPYLTASIGLVVE